MRIGRAAVMMSVLSFIASFPRAGSVLFKHHLFIVGDN